MGKISLSSLSSRDRTRLDKLIEQLEQAAPVLRWRSAQLSVQEERVWQAVLRAFASSGRAPRRWELLEGELSSEAASACLERLAAKDVLVLDSRSGEILGAYPFSARPTRHRVSFGAQTVYAMCAIDALGMAAMLGRKVQVESSCPLCGGAIAMKSDAQAIARLEPASVVVWFPNESEARGNCCADWLCPEINFFCSDKHLNKWRLERAEAGGHVLAALEALYLAKRFFAGLLEN